MLFVIFLDRVLHRLRPVAVAALVSDYLHRDFERLAGMLAAPGIFWGRPENHDEPPLFVARAERYGAIQAVDAAGLYGWAQRAPTAWWWSVTRSGISCPPTRC